MPDEQINIMDRVLNDSAFRDMWPAAPSRPLVRLATARDGTVSSVTLNVIPAARDFVRSRLIRYRATGTGGRDLWDRAVWDESTGSITFEGLDQSRVREQLDAYLAGLEDGLKLAAATVSSSKNVDAVYREAKLLPWGETGNAEETAPLVDFVRRVLAVEFGSGKATVTSEELLCLYTKFTGDDPGDDWGRRKLLLGDLARAVEIAFRHERGVRYSSGNISRANCSAAGYQRTTRHRGWIGLRIDGPYSHMVAHVHGVNADAHGLTQTSACDEGTQN